MVRRHLQSTKAPTKTLHATLLGALLGLVGLLIASMITSGVRLQYRTTPLPIFADSLSPLSFGVYALLGGITIGGVVAFLYERYRAALPSIVVTLVYLVAIGWTGWQIQSWDGPSGPQEPIPPVLPWVTAFEYLVVGWPLLLVMALGSGLIEHRLRIKGPSEKNS